MVWDWYLAPGTSDCVEENRIQCGSFVLLYITLHYIVELLCVTNTTLATRIHKDFRGIVFMRERTLTLLDLSEFSSQVGTKWRKWKHTVKYCAERKGINSSRKKTSLLLYLAGMEVQDIFEDIVDPEPEGNQDPYTVCIRKLDYHFQCKENVPFECYMFWLIGTKTDGEPVD